MNIPTIRSHDSWRNASWFQKTSVGSLDTDLPCCSFIELSGRGLYAREIIHYPFSWTAILTTYGYQRRMTRTCSRIIYTLVACLFRGSIVHIHRNIHTEWKRIAYVIPREKCWPIAETITVRLSSLIIGMWSPRRQITLGWDIAIRCYTNLIPLSIIKAIETRHDTQH
jgi:hypothetical protein